MTISAMVGGGFSREKGGIVNVGSSGIKILEKKSLKI